MNTESEITIAISQNDTARGLGGAFMSNQDLSIRQFADQFKKPYIKIPDEEVEEVETFNEEAKVENKKAKAVNALIRERFKGTPQAMFKGMLTPYKELKSWKDTKYYSMSSLVNGSVKRNKDNLLDANILIMDCDESINDSSQAPPVLDFIKAMDSLNVPYLVYSSASNQGSLRHKYRGVVFISEPVNGYQIETIYKDLVSKVQKFGVPLAEASESYIVSQAWYYPVTPKSYVKDYIFYENLKPDLLDVKKTLEEIKQRGSRDPLQKRKDPLKSKNRTTSTTQYRRSRFLRNSHPTPKSHAEMFVHKDGWNNLEFWLDLLETHQYEYHGPKFVKETGREEHIYRREGSTNSPGGHLFFGNDEKWKYYTYHGDNDLLKGPRIKEGEEGHTPTSKYRAMDALDAFEALEIGATVETVIDEDGKEKIVKSKKGTNRLNVEFEKLFMKYLSDRFIYLDTGNGAVLDRKKPAKEPMLAAGFKRKFNGLRFSKVIVDKEKKDKVVKVDPGSNWIEGLGKGFTPRIDVDGLRFDPTQQKIFVTPEDGHIYLNEYIPPIFEELGPPPSIDPKYIKIFDNRVGFMCNYKEYETNLLRCFIAHGVQFPGIRLPFAMQLTSTVEGVGKTSLLDFIGCIIGDKYVNAININAIRGFKQTSASGFDDDIHRRLFVGVDEIVARGTDRYLLRDALKDFLTDTRGDLSLKYKRSSGKKQFLAFLFSNYESPVPLDGNDRRYCCIHFNAPEGMEGLEKLENGYIRKMIGDSFKIVNQVMKTRVGSIEWNKGMEAFYHIYWYLKRLDLTEFLKYDRAPLTDHKRFIIEESEDEPDKILRHMKNKHKIKFAINTQIMGIVKQELGDRYNEKNINFIYTSINKVFKSKKIDTVNINPHTYKYDNGTIGNLEVMATLEGKRIHDRWLKGDPSVIPEGYHKGRLGKKGLIAYMKHEIERLQKCYNPFTVDGKRDL